MKDTALAKQLSGKNVLFVTTKNASYLRNVQEINIIKENAAHHKEISSKHRWYPARLLKVYGSLFAALFSRTYDVVFFGFAPQLVFFFFPFFRFKKTPIYIDFFISFYDTLVFDRKKITQDGFWGRLLHRIDAYVLRKADFVVVDTKAHRDYFIEEFSSPPSKFHVLYLCADQSIYYPRQVLKRLEQQADKYTILYFGSVLPLQGVDIVLEAINLLSLENDLHFIFVGPLDSSAEKEVLKASNISYYRWVDQETLANLIAGSDLCLAGHFNKEIDKAKRTIPGKAYIYKAMDKPMVLGDNSANRELYSPADPGNLYVPMGNAKALADTIVQASRGQEGKNDK